MASYPTRRTQAERTAATRSALLRSARRLFSTQGYAATGLDQVVADSGLTRGALYHHFDGKVELFAAVVGAIDEDLYDVVLAAGRRAPNTAEAFRRGIRTYVEASARSGDLRILADVPAVLGPETYHQISAARCMPLIEMAFSAAAAEGIDLPGDPPVLAAMLLGALDEAVLILARDPESRAHRRSVLRTVDALIDRLLAA